MKRILIVDDHGELRKLVRLTLQYGDFELHEASNGERALQLVNAINPDLVLLDVMMPGGLDGYQVCEKIKESPQLQGIKVILLTARGQKADLEEGKRVKADRYMLKPFSPLELIETVDSILGNTGNSG